MSVSNPSLNRLLSASPFDLAPRDSASGRFNQHLHVRRREGGALPSSTNGGAATAVTATAATNHMCDQCGGIGGHATGCTAAGVAAVSSSQPTTNSRTFILSNPCSAARLFSRAVLGGPLSVASQANLYFVCCADVRTPAMMPCG